MKNYKKILVIMMILAVVPVFSACQKNDEQSAEQSDFIELSQDVIKENKIETLSVIEKPVTTTINTNGEIKTDEDKFYSVSSMIMGRITKSPVKLGDYVHAGQVLAYIQNPEITRINAEATKNIHENRIAIRQVKTRLNLAKANYEREQRLYKEGISPQKDLIQAQSDYLLAKDDLALAYERETHIKQEVNAVMGTYGVRPNFDTENLATQNPICAMKSGIITKKNIKLGEVVTPEQVLFEITDMSKLWLDITLYSSDIAQVEKGQKVEFTPDSLSGKKFYGTIDYIQPQSNDATQTFVARAFMDNSLSLLRPGMYGDIKIINNHKENKAYVPISAVQKYGKETFVFLDLGDGKYKKQEVVLGERDNDGYFINEGLNLGDKVVGNGSFTLKSEMLKSELAEED